MKAGFILTAIVAFLAAFLITQKHDEQTSFTQYQQWKNDFGQLHSISEADDQFRFKIFEQNLK